MRDRLLHGIHAVFTKYVWIVATLWLVWIGGDLILGLLVFPRARGGIWYIGLGGTLGCIIGAGVIALLKAVFHKRVKEALDRRKGSDA